MWLTVILSAIVLLLFALQQTMLQLPSLRTIYLFAKLPGPWRIPLVGLAFEVFRRPNDIFNILDAYSKRYNGFMATYLMGIPAVILQDPDDIKVVLRSNDHIDKGVLYKFLEAGLGRGLVTSGGDKWRNRRRVLNTAFHNEILEGNVGNFWNNAISMTRSMLKDSGDGPVKLKDYFNPCALNIIGETAMGVHLNESESQQFLDAILSFADGIQFRIEHPYLKNEWLWKLTPGGRKSYEAIDVAERFSTKIVRQRMANYDPSKTLGSDDVVKGNHVQPLLDMMLNVNYVNPGSLTMEDIIEEVNTFTVAGHETVAGSSAYALWLLGLNPEIQAKVYAELHSIFGDDDRTVTMEDLKRMTYLEKVIKETLRLYPIGAVFMRQLSRDLQLEGKPLIPSGVNVFISPFLLHRDDKYFPDPLNFNPERFEPDACAARHPYVYLPFSAGPRNCIGKKYAMYEMKVLLSTVIRFCKVTSVTKEEDVKFLPHVTLQPSIPLEVLIEPRAKS